MIFPNRTLLAAATSVAALALILSPHASAGCLAPADIQIDVAGTPGPFWGNDDGGLLYARGSGAAQELIRRGFGEFPETVAEAGQGNGFVVGTEEESWVAFHGGAMNDRGDAAFVASTTVDDDTATPEDESIARRGAYVLRGNTTFELGRFGGPSPIVDPFAGRIPWGSFFDAVPLGRPDAGLISAVFSAQLAAPDGRQGLFVWDELSGVATPLVLTGQPSPAGGVYSTFGRLRSNEAGDVVFYALTQVSPTAPVAPGLFRIAAEDVGANPAVGRIVKFGDDGDDVAGIGRFSLLQDFDLDGAGGVTFASAVEGGPAAPSGLFRWSSSTLQFSTVVVEGDATPLGGRYVSFLQALVRVDELGTAVFAAPLSDDIGGTGFFSVQAGASEANPLGAAFEPFALASLGAGRLAYQIAEETRRIVPAAEDEDGLPDFRVALGDFRNSATLRKDVLVSDVRFRLPPWGDGAGQAPPATFLADAPRLAPTHAFTAAEVAHVVEVRLAVPAHVFVFGIGGTAQSPLGTVSVNQAAGTVQSLALAKTGDTATWRFTHGIGSGTFTVDFAKGVAKLSVKKANLFLPGVSDRATFLSELTFRTLSDVGAARTGDAAYFHRSLRPLATQPSVPNGFRIFTRGEVVGGGTFYLDTVRVDRKLKVLRGQAAPQVTSDKIVLKATLRLCLGSTAPTTPSVLADVTVGDLVLDDFLLRRVGRNGSKYSGKATVGTVKVSLVFDAIKGTVSFVATNVPPLSQLVNADFSGATATNGSKVRVGGMSLPVSISIDRVYATTQDVGMTRLPRAKTFVR